MIYFKGTKGKWFSDNGEISSENGDYICDVLINSKEDLYNSLLIKKAPELLDVVLNIINDERFLEMNIERVNKLIKEATDLPCKK